MEWRPPRRRPLALSLFSSASGSAISAGFVLGRQMKRVLFSAAVLFAASHAAFASANLDCTAVKDKAVSELVIEAITSRDGKYLDNMRGELELSSGIKVEFDKSNVKSYNAARNIAMVIAVRAAQGPVEIRIFAKPKPSDDVDNYEGTFVVAAGKVKHTGKIKCSAG